MAESNNVNKTQSFSRREWLMLIAIFGGVEAVILNLSYIFQSQQEVVSYISFAATIASLLLALIAIIYGYYQSDGQQRSAAAIASQIDSMRSVQKELNGVSHGISEQLAGMSSTAGELRRLSESLDGTHKALGQIEGGINGVIAEQLAIKTAVASFQFRAEPKLPEIPQKSQSIIDRVELARIFFKSGTSDLTMLGVALHELVKKNGGIAQSWTKFIEEHFAKPLVEPDVNLSQYRNTVVGLQILQICHAVKLVRLYKLDGSLPESPLALEVKKEIFEVLAESATAVLENDDVLKVNATKIHATF